MNNRYLQIYLIMIFCKIIIRYNTLVLLKKERNKIKKKKSKNQINI